MLTEIHRYVYILSISNYQGKKRLKKRLLLVDSFIIFENKVQLSLVSFSVF